MSTAIQCEIDLDLAKVGHAFPQLRAVRGRVIAIQRGEPETVRGENLERCVVIACWLERP